MTEIVDLQLPTKKLSFEDRVNKLTIGEMGTVQKITGEPWSSTKAVERIEYMGALYFVWKRREDKTLVSYTQVEDVPIQDVLEYLGINDIEGAVEEPVVAEDPFVEGESEDTKSDEL